MTDEQKDQEDGPASGRPIDPMEQIAGLGASSVLKAIDALHKQQRRIASWVDSPAVKALQEQQRHIASWVDSPAMKAMQEQQRHIASWVDSPAVKALQEQQRRIASIVDSSVLGAFRGGLAHVYERTINWLDRHWADLETENLDHPHPVLFLIASFSMAVGLPIYESAKMREDDTALLATLEPVLTDAEFVDSVKAAIRSAPFLGDIAKEHLETGFDWLVRKELVKAYPPFYNGLEPALRSAARAQGVIDADNRFIHSRGKVKKIDDVFGALIKDPRYRRYLRSWIFGDHGNQFRHGDVDDASECRRQSLRLAAAVVGWLEIFGGWTEAEFARRLEASARQHLAITRGGEEAQAA